MSGAQETQGWLLHKVASVTAGRRRHTPGGAAAPWHADPGVVILFLHDASSDTSSVSRPQLAVASCHLTILVVTALLCNTKLCITSALKASVCSSCRALRHAGNIYKQRLLAAPHAPFSLYNDVYEDVYGTVPCQSTHRSCRSTHRTLTFVTSTEFTLAPSLRSLSAGPLFPLPCHAASPRHTDAQLLLSPPPFHAQHLCTPPPPWLVFSESSSGRDSMRRVHHLLVD